MVSRSLLLALVLINLSNHTSGQLIISNLDSLVSKALEFEFTISRLDTSLMEMDSTMMHIYYDKNNTIRKVVQYSSNRIIGISNYNTKSQLDGVHVYLTGNGMIERVSFYVDGEGITMNYYPNGTIKEWYLSNNGIVNGRRQQFYSDGQLLNDTYFDGVNWIETGYYEDGAVEYRGIGPNRDENRILKYFNRRGRRIRK